MELYAIYKHAKGLGAVQVPQTALLAHQNNMDAPFFADLDKMVGEEICSQKMSSSDWMFVTAQTPALAIEVARPYLEQTNAGVEVDTDMRPTRRARSLYGQRRLSLVAR